jgi:hypothetical protein
MRAAIGVVVAAVAATLLPGSVAQAASGIDAHIVTADPQVEQPLQIDGTVSDPTALDLVSVRRDDSDGSHVLSTTVPVAEDGSFTYTDTPPVRGSVTYAVGVFGSGVPDVLLGTYVAGHPTDMAATVTRSVVNAGRTVTVTGRLVSEQPAAGHLRIYARPYGKDQVLIGDLSSGRDLSADFKVTRRTSFVVRFLGAKQYEPSQAGLVVKARAVVRNRLGGGYATRNGYRLYVPSADPPLYGHIFPERKGVCLYYRVQRYRDGWRDVLNPLCVRTDADGRTLRVLQGDHVADRPYRVRVEWRGSKTWLKDYGAWQKLKFHRR